MPAISVDLPDDLQAFVASAVKGSNFATASDYVAALVEAARQKKHEIDLALLEGLASGPAEEWKPSEWKAMKQRVVNQHKQV